MRSKREPPRKSILKTTKTNTDSRQFYSQQLSLEKGKTYTLSAYVRADNISNSKGKGGSIFFNYYNKTGVLQTVDSTFAGGTKPWDRYEEASGLQASH